MRPIRNEILNATAVFAIALALAGCTGAAPTDTVQCSASTAITETTGAGTSGTTLVVQSVTYQDTGEPNTVDLPLNNENVRVISSSPTLVTICPGNCTASGVFGSDVTVETDKDGVLIYTVNLIDTGTLTGEITEVVGGQAPTSCTVDFTTS
jgi:hypothetical protein